MIRLPDGRVGKEFVIYSIGEGGKIERDWSMVRDLEREQGV